MRKEETWRKTLGARTRTNRKINPLMTLGQLLGLGFKPGPDWWETIAATLCYPWSWANKKSSFFQVADLTHFLRMSDSRLQFIWSSEISGFRHLYLATANSNHTLTRARAGSFIAECCIHYPLVTQRQLTDGDWQVDGKEVGTWE